MWDFRLRRRCKDSRGIGIQYPMMSDGPALPNKNKKDKKDKKENGELASRKVNKLNACSIKRKRAVTNGEGLQRAKAPLNLNLTALRNAKLPPSLTVPADKKSDLVPPPPLLSPSSITPLRQVFSPRLPPRLDLGPPLPSNLKRDTLSASCDKIPTLASHSARLGAANQVLSNRATSLSLFTTRRNVDAVLDLPMANGTTEDVTADTAPPIPLPPVDSLKLPPPLAAPVVEVSTPRLSHSREEDRAPDYLLRVLNRRREARE